MRTTRTGPSRRNVLAGGVTAFALSACGSDTLPALFGAAAPSGKGTSAAPLATAEVAAWIAAAGTTFNAGGHPLRLIGIEPVGPGGGRPAELRQQGFLATFETLDGATLAGERNYTVTHSSIPTFDIHLTNSASMPSRMLAAFN